MIVVPIVLGLWFGFGWICVIFRYLNLRDDNQPISLKEYSWWQWLTLTFVPLIHVVCFIKNIDNKIHDSENSEEQNKQKSEAEENDDSKEQKYSDSNRPDVENGNLNQKPNPPQPNFSKLTPLEKMEWKNQQESSQNSISKGQSYKQSYNSQGIVFTEDNKNLQDNMIISQVKQDYNNPGKLSSRNSKVNSGGILKNSTSLSSKPSPVKINQVTPIDNLKVEDSGKGDQSESRNILISQHNPGYDLDLESPNINRNQSNSSFIDIRPVNMNLSKSNARSRNMLGMKSKNMAIEESDFETINIDNSNLPKTNINARTNFNN